jgi:DNA-binding LytR/AlgR family response regulator
MKPILSSPSYSTETILMLSNNDGLFYPRLSQIVYCKSDDTYTEVHLKDGQVIVVSTNLKYYEDLLQGFGFFRIHQTYLLNTAYLVKISGGTNNWQATISNNEVLPIGQKKKIELAALLEKSSVNMLCAPIENMIAADEIKLKITSVTPAAHVTAKEVRLMRSN